MIKGFKAIPLQGYTGYYASKDGRIYSGKTDKILKPHVNRAGYVTYGLSSPGMPGKTIQGHTLVALTYLEKTNKKHDRVNHKDGVKNNNKLSNLEWTDAKGNSDHYQKKLRPKKIKTIKTTNSVDVLGMLKTLHGSVSMETFNAVFKDLTKVA